MMDLRRIMEARLERDALKVLSSVDWSGRIVLPEMLSWPFVPHNRPITGIRQPPPLRGFYAIKYAYYEPEPVPKPDCVMNATESYREGRECLRCVFARLYEHLDLRDCDCTKRKCVTDMADTCDEWVGVIYSNTGPGMESRIAAFFKHPTWATRVIRLGLDYEGG